MHSSSPPLSLPSRLREALRRLRDYWTLTPTELGLVLLVMFAFGYFFTSGKWNQNARLDAIYAFVEPGPDQYTFRINRFIFDPVKNLNTGDWARLGSNYYANKAPGTILIGVLVYWPLHWLETVVLGFDAYHPVVEIANAYFINFAVSVLFAAMGALLYRRLLEGFEVPPRRALFITLALAFGTAMFPYSTTLWGTATTTTLVIAGYVGLRLATKGSITAAGASLGFAVCSDYLAVLFVIMAGAYMLLHERPRFGWFCLGGVPALVVLLGYQQYCFGSPFTTASSLSQAGFLDQNRWLGMLGWPSPTALFQLTFGPARGVFFQMPVLLLAAAGSYYWLKRAPRDPWLWLCSLSFVVPLVVVSGFNGWHGGASVSARYLISALPWLVLTLKELPGSRRWSVVLVVLTMVSALNMLAVAATSSLVPDYVDEPLYSWVYPLFLAGDFGSLAQPTRLQLLHPAWSHIAPLTCFNLGEVLGLSAYASLLPLFAVVVPLIRLLYRRTAARVQYQSRDRMRAL